MRRYFLGLLFFLIGSNLWAQEFIPLGAWGLYLDHKDKEARSMANEMADSGFSMEYIKTYDGFDIILVPGNPEPWTSALRKRRRDGVHVVYRKRVPVVCDTIITRDTLIRWKNIRNNFYSQYVTQLPEKLPKRYSNLSENELNKYLRRQHRTFRKFLKGKRVKVHYMDEMRWIALGVPQPKEDEELVFQFVNDRQDKVSLRYDTLLGRNTDRFYALDNGPCKPYNRITAFRSLTEEKFSYPRNYRPRDSRMLKRTFTFTFDQNEVNYTPDMLMPVIELMTKSSLTIYSAKVEGYASVEGTSEINESLQRRRANKLIEILEKYNDEKVELDTVISREQWDMFYNQISNTPYAWMDTLSRMEIKKLLQDEVLAREMEPILAPQRKAILTVLAYERVEQSEKINRAFLDLENTRSFIISGRKPPARVNMQERYLAIMHYLQLMAEKGIISKESIKEALGEDAFAMDMLYKKYKADWLQHKELPQLFQLDTLLSKINSSYIKAMESELGTPGGRYQGIQTGEYIMNRLAGLQFFADTLSQKKLISPDFLIKEIIYPRSPRYYGLILNKMLINDRLDQEKGNFEELITSQLDGKKSNIYSLDDPYYFLLKEIILRENRQILQYVYRSDNMYYFDLMSFLKPNVDSWNILTGDYFDPEVDREKMRELIAKLDQGGAMICERDKMQLVIDFYFKDLKLIALEGVANEEEEKIAINIFYRLRNYYRYYAASLSEEQLLSITKQFAVYDGLFLSRDGTEAAYSILKAAESHNDYKGDLKKWFLQLSYYHNSRFVDIMMSEDEKEFCEFFSGPNSLIPFKDMLIRYCQSCN